MLHAWLDGIALALVITLGIGTPVLVLVRIASRI